MDAHEVTCKILRIRQSTSVKEKQNAREPGANPGHPSCQSFHKCTAVDLWLIDTRCGHDLVSKSQVYAMNRWLERAKYLQHSVLQMAARPPMRSRGSSRKTWVTNSSLRSSSDPGGVSCWFSMRGDGLFVHLADGWYTILHPA